MEPMEKEGELIFTRKTGEQRFSGPMRLWLDTNSGGAKMPDLRSVPRVTLANWGRKIRRCDESARDGRSGVDQPGPP